MNIRSSSEVDSGTCKKVEPKCGKASYNQGPSSRASCKKGEPTLSFDGPFPPVIRSVRDGKGFTRGIERTTMYHGWSSILEHKMKYLTPLYLSLMHAFKDHAFKRLDALENSCMYPISMMQEYGTLRIDGGRQSGKTEAAARFAAEWLAEGNSVIVMGVNSSIARDTRDRIMRRWAALDNNDKIKGVLIDDTIRSFLGETWNKYRGISLQRTLIIIEEPMRIPEMYKFYAAYEDLTNRNLCQVPKPLPLFFVMGIQ